jgi:hypothetical protein
MREHVESKGKNEEEGRAWNAQKDCSKRGRKFLTNFKGKSLRFIVCGVKCVQSARTLLGRLLGGNLLGRSLLGLHRGARVERVRGGCESEARVAKRILALEEKTRTGRLCTRSLQRTDASMAQRPQAAR